MSCVLWCKCVLQLSGFALCGRKAWWSRRLLCCVMGRYTETVRSWVMCREGVPELSGLVLCGGKAHWSCHVLCCMLQRRGIAVGSCVVWWEGVLTPSRVLRCVQGRRTEAVGSCVVWLEGVLKLSGHVRLYLWVLSCIQRRRTEAVGSWVVYREGDWKLSGLVCLYSLKQLKLFSRKPTQANKKNIKIIIHSSIGKTTKITKYNHIKISPPTGRGRELKWSWYLYFVTNGNMNHLNVYVNKSFKSPRVMSLVTATVEKKIDSIPLLFLLVI